MYLLLALMQAANALMPDRPLWLRCLGAVCVVLFIAGLFYQRVFVAGARRYLERARSA
jgi:uncharacterized membrane protein